MSPRERMYHWERWGFAVALILAVLYVGAETIAVYRGATGPRPIPWGFLFIEGALLLPITLGRLTAGRIWEGAARMLPRPPRSDDDDGNQRGG